MGLSQHVEFQKKTMNQSQENFRTEERKDGLTLIHRTLPVTAGGQIRGNEKITLVEKDEIISSDNEIYNILKELPPGINIQLKINSWSL